MLAHPKNSWADRFFLRPALAVSKRVVKSESQNTYDLMTLFHNLPFAFVAAGRASNWPGWMHALEVAGYHRAQYFDPTRTTSRL